MTAGASIEHRFGPYGGQYVPETLMPALAELELEWLTARADRAFQERLRALLRDFVGRPSPLYLAQRLSAAAGLSDDSSLADPRGALDLGWARLSGDRS